jgi:hypothetical protein
MEEENKGEKHIQEEHEKFNTLVCMRYETCWVLCINNFHL